MSDVSLNSLPTMYRKSPAAAVSVPMKVLNFNPGGAIKDIRGIFVTDTPAWNSQAQGLGKTLEEGAKFVGNSPAELRSLSH